MFQQARINGSYYHHGAFERLEKLKVGDNVNLERESDNEYDPNAIKVLDTDGGMLGYVAAGNGANIIIAQLMDAGEDVRAEVSQKSTAMTYINIFTADEFPEEDEVTNDTELIKLVQLPVIEERLRSLGEDIDKKVNEAMNLVCNEDTVKAVKTVRAELNKQYQEFETQRKAIKTAIMEPYEAFEKVYKEFVSSKYTNADKDLKIKIDSVENELKSIKESDVKEYFDELAQSLNIDFITFEQINLKVNLSDSVKKLKEKVHKLLTKVSEDIKMIATLDEDIRADVMAEFKSNGFNAANAAITVTERNRRKREEAENIRRAEEQRTAEAERVAQARAAAGVTVKAPEVKTPTEVTQEKLFSLKFKVTATKAQLMELKAFLTTGGYTYESIK